ncbi:hypothetical protein HY837_05055 [archaeon]|nr:hypothetical protein [archaeon]
MKIQLRFPKTFAEEATLVDLDVTQDTKIEDIVRRVSAISLSKFEGFYYNGCPVTDLGRTKGKLENDAIYYIDSYRTEETKERLSQIKKSTSRTSNNI